jgi:predicted amidohydrolase
MKVAIAQLKPKLGELKENLEKIVEVALKAKDLKAQVCFFPELSLTGYNLQDLTHEVAIELEDPFFSPVIELSREIAVGIGFVEKEKRGLFFNSYSVFKDGDVIALHRKVYLPTYGMFDEGRFFAQGDRFDTFEVNGVKTSILICEDAWHFSSVYLAWLKGAEFILSPSASPVRGFRSAMPDNLRIWKNMGEFYSRMTGSYFAFVNLVGSEDGCVFPGGSFAFDPNGNLICEAPLFEENITIFEIDHELLRTARYNLPLLRDEKLELVKGEISRIS